MEESSAPRDSLSHGIHDNCREAQEPGSSPIRKTKITFSSGPSGRKMDGQDVSLASEIGPDRDWKHRPISSDWRGFPRDGTGIAPYAPHQSGI